LLGRTVTAEEYGQLDTFPADPDLSLVELTGDELTALCPGVAGLQPDFYRWSIRYRPRQRCIESKSLKLYLLTFRDEPIFAEHLCARIARDLAAVLDTEVTVRLTQQRRGGIETTAEATSAPAPGPVAPTRALEPGR
jgi:7-cyano-7-deazaguanine reductase